MGDIDGTSFVPSSMVTKEARMGFQSKMASAPSPGWVKAHPQVWLAEVLEAIHEHSPSFYVVLDPDTTREIHWRIKPRDKSLIEEISKVFLRAGAVYDMLEEKGLLDE